MSRIHIRGSGGSSGGSTATYADDTLQSKSYFAVLDLLGEGIIGGPISGLQGVFINGSPIENKDGSRNIENVTFAWTAGSVDQNPINGFDTIQSPYSVGSEVTKSGGQKTITIDDPNVDSVRVIVTFPALSQSSKSNGSVTGVEVSYKLEVSTDGGSYEPVMAGSTLVDGGVISQTMSEDGYLCYEVTPTTCTSGHEDEAGAGATLVVSSDNAGASGVVVQRQYYSNGEWHDYESEVQLFIDNAPQGGGGSPGGNGGSGTGGGGS